MAIRRGQRPMGTLFLAGNPKAYSTPQKYREALEREEQWGFDSLFECAVAQRIEEYAQRGELTLLYRSSDRGFWLKKIRARLGDGSHCPLDPSWLEQHKDRLDALFDIDAFPLKPE
jgi:hypothetical protein